VRRDVAWGALILVAACRAGPGPEDTTDSDDSAGPAGSIPPLFSCTRDGYPCDATDVAPSDREAADALMQEVRERLVDGETPAALYRWLNQQPAVVQRAVGADSVAFRTEGAHPRAVLSAGALKHDVEAGPPRSEVRGGPPRGIVGRPGSDRSALVLSLFPVDFGPVDDGPVAADALHKDRAYTGRVTVRENRRVEDLVDEGDIARMSEFDVTHLSTHGDRLCDEEADRCELVLALYRYEETVLPPGLDGSFPGAVALSSDAVMVPGSSLSRLFPGGLEDRFVFLSACHSFAQSDLADALAGEDTVVFGWDEYVPAPFAKGVVDRFYEEALTHGRVTGAVLATLREEGLTSTDFDDHGRQGTVSLVTNAPGDREGTRLREIVAMYSGDGLLPLQDGDSLPLVGVAGDGRADGLDLSFEVDGIEDGEVSDYAVEILLDGRPVGGVEVADGTPVSPWRWSVPADVALPEDLEPGEHVLRAEVALPEGGRSVVERRLRSTAPAWRMEVTGAGAGVYEGQAVVATTPQGSGVVLSLRTEVGGAEYASARLSDGDSCPTQGVLPATFSLRVPGVVEVGPCDAVLDDVSHEVMQEATRSTFEIDASGACAGSAARPTFEAHVRVTVEPALDCP